MRDVAHLRALGIVGDVERWKLRGAQRLVDSVAAGFEQLAIEIHVDDAFIRLDDAILKAGADSELFLLDRERQPGEKVLGDFHVVELHEGAEGRDDDRAVAGEADESGAIGFEGDREVAVLELDIIVVAVIAEALDGGFDEAHATVVAVERYVAEEGLDIVESAEVAV